MLADLGYAPLGPGVLAPAGSPAAAFELRSRAWRAAFDPAGIPDVTDVADVRDPADAVS